MQTSRLCRKGATKTDENEIIPVDEDGVAEDVKPDVLADGETKIDYIRRRQAEGANAKAIAGELGITLQSVYRIIRKDEGRGNKWDNGYQKPPPPPPKRPRGRPKGSKNKPGVTKAALTLIDQKTGIAVSNTGQQSIIIGRMGDEKVSKFVAYHMDCLKMRQGVDKSNVPDLYKRFYIYLGYCQEHGIIPNNMNCYLAIGVSKQDMSAWHRGLRSEAHREFADTVMEFFASVHEQMASDGIGNPISAMFWQKAHDNMVEASKLEVIQEDPLGSRKSAQALADKYKDILPEDA